MRFDERYASESGVSYSTSRIDELDYSPGNELARMRWVAEIDNGDASRRSASASVSDWSPAQSTDYQREISRVR